jgi:hypothetical protein
MLYACGELIYTYYILCFVNSCFSRVIILFSKNIFTERSGRKYQEDVMRKAYLITAILLLSAVWVVAQTSPSSQSPSSTSPSTSSPQSTTPSSGYPQTTSPSSTSPSSQTPDTSSTTTTTSQTTQTSSSSDANAQTIEGCLSGSAGNFTLTDQSGKTYQLAGDTSKLSDHVGHQVRITGSEGSGAGASESSSSSANPPSSSAGTNPPSSAGTNPSSSASNPSGGAAPSTSGMGASSQMTFNVKKVKMISSSCTAGTK